MQRYAVWAVTAICIVRSVGMKVMGLGRVRRGDIEGWHLLGVREMEGRRRRGRGRLLRDRWKGVRSSVI